MRLALLALALLSGLFVSVGLASPAPLVSKGSSITMVGSTSDHTIEVVVSYETAEDGSQSGSITIKLDGEKEGTTHKFSYLSYSSSGLEAYWGTEGGGVSITFDPDGESTGSVTIPGVGGSIQIKQK